MQTIRDSILLMVEELLNSERLTVCLHSLDYCTVNVMMCVRVCVFMYTCAVTFEHIRARKSWILKKSRSIQLYWSGVEVVLQWVCNGVAVVLHRCFKSSAFICLFICAFLLFWHMDEEMLNPAHVLYSDVTLVLQLYYIFVAMESQWCHIGVTVVSYRCCKSVFIRLFIALFLLFGWQFHQFAHTRVWSRLCRL
jgi:hypothetical protein